MSCCRRFSSGGSQKDIFKLLKCLILTIASLSHVYKTVTTVCNDTDDEDFTNIFANKILPNYNLLTSSGFGKSKFDIYSQKLPFRPQNSTNFLSLLLILSGNIEINPGPSPIVNKSTNSLLCPQARSAAK